MPAPRSPPQAAKATTASVPAPHLDVKSWSLANGLQVLFLADHKAPIATVQVFYHVGSKDEHPGIRGVAHMFEHLMFKGSTHVPPEEHARLLKEVGGVVNAFTTEDLTAYHDTVPPSYVGFALQLEAERMRQLKLFPTTIDSERHVVEEEKRLRIDNDPVGKALERFRALAYTQHPYNWTAIGTIEDLEKVTPADCQRFYDTYYRPNNATLIVIGDLDEQVVRKLIEQHFGAIPRGPELARKYPVEPPQTGPADGVVADGGPDSGHRRRLPRAARRRSGHAGAGGAGHDLVGGGFVAPDPAARAPRPPGDRRGWRDRVDGGLRASSSSTRPTCPTRTARRFRPRCPTRSRRVRDAPVAADELDKAKNQLAAGFVFGLETVDGIAQRLGQAQYVEGDWHRFIEGASRYLAVTADDVQRVAKKYLVDTNLTRVTLVPPGAPLPPPATGVQPPGAKP